MTKLQAWLLSTFFFGFIAGIIVHCLIQNQVCSEIADLMGSGKKYTILSGCRWDLPQEDPNFLTDQQPTK